jgi:predicted short-subunit dehydrogenase-like oxidoreductase (DUF2520 family)
LCTEINLTPALVKSGYAVESIISKSSNSAQKLAQKFSIKHYSNSINDLLGNINTFFLTVPDSEIKNASLKLSEFRKQFKNCIVLHFSGVKTIKALEAVKRKGADIGSLHFMQTFPNKRVINLKGVHASIETSSNVVLRFLEKLGRDLQLKTFQIKSDDKVYYHLAGVLASNFMAGNIFNSEFLLNKCKIKKFNSFNILSSTIYGTVKNIEQLGAANALSGPIDRGDIDTIKLHLSSIKKLKNKKANKEIGSLLIKNYLNQSLGLLLLVEKKISTLTDNHIKIKKLLLNALKNVS